MPLQNAPIVPSWRPMTSGEMDALILFWRATPNDPPLPLRAQLIETVGIVSPTLPREDVLWNAVGVAGLIYGANVVAPGALPSGAPADLLEIGIAGVAGNVPELLTDLGFDAPLLSQHGYLMIKPWRQMDLSGMSQDDVARIGAIHREWASEAPAAMHRASEAFIAWVARRRLAFQASPVLQRQHDWIFNFLAKTVTNIASPAASRAAIVTEARQRGRRDRCPHPEDADDVLAAFWTRDWSEAKAEPQLGTFLGRDRVWHINAKHLMDSATVGGDRDRPAEVCATDARDENDTNDFMACVEATGASDPLMAAAESDFREKIRHILLAEAIDELDRENVRLLLCGIANRSERARRLGKGDTFLLRRQKRMAQRALPAAPAELRSAIRAILAA